MNIRLIFIIALIFEVKSRNVQKREIDVKVRLCVPRKYIADCLKLYANNSSDERVSCIAARDQMECLEYVKKREADVMVADPEDMYVAYHLENDDFDIIQEIRTVEESHSAFRYDGIILVKKGSNIHTLKDLKGKRSCHTGFGRNVGYKIPLTKLRKNEVLKLSNDPELSSTEKELDALSLFFEKACIVGQWSPDKLVNDVFKKRYSNLCALCKDPAKCDYPDKFSGYDGAVRCVVEGQGDVAFTKTYFVKKHFNIPIVAGQIGSPNSDTENYEYMCEDGRRTPITDQNPCSWAQRPWQAYMSNADAVSHKPIIQGYLSEFFEQGKTRLTKDEAAHLFIKDSLTTFNNSEVVRPHAHLFNAHYKDVIERDGTEQGVIRFCVSSEVEMRKCKWLKQAAYSRDIRPQLECVQKGREACLEAVANGKVEVVVVPQSLNKQAAENNLLQILTEKFDDNDVYVALVDNDFGENDIPTSSLKFDSSQLRAVSAALYLNSKRGISKCPNAMSSDELAKIQIVNARNIGDEYKSANKQLLCQDWTKKTLSDYKTCNFDYSLPNGIYVNKAESRQTRDNIRHAFTAIGKSFGPKGKLNHVFDLVGQFEPGHKDVIFSGDALDIVPEAPLNIDKNFYNSLHCL